VVRLQLRRAVLGARAVTLAVAAALAFAACNTGDSPERTSLQGAERAPSVVVKSYPDEPPAASIAGVRLPTMSSYWQGADGVLHVTRPETESEARDLAKALPSVSLGDLPSVQFDHPQAPTMMVVASYADVDEAGIPQGDRDEYTLNAADIMNLAEEVSGGIRLGLSIPRGARLVTIVAYYQAPPTEVESNPSPNSASWSFEVNKH